MEPSTSQQDEVALSLSQDEIKRFNSEGRDHNTFQQSLSESVIVIFSLETTGFVKSAEICQISALCNDNLYIQHIIPNMEFEHFATNRNGFYIWGTKLYHNEDEVEDVLSPRDGLNSFLEFLREQSGEARGKTILAGHNCSRYAAHKLVRQMIKYNLLDSFLSVVLGFIDTLTIFKSYLPERVKEKKNFDLETLKEDYCLQHIDDKVEVLAQLIKKIGCDESKMKESVRNVYEFIRSLPESMEYIEVGLQPIAGVVSKTMLEKIVKAGITIDMLKDEYRSNGHDGVKILLQEVIKAKKIIQSITNVLDELTSEDNKNTQASE